MAHRVKFKRPCNDCPFRRDSTPGWLGSGSPEHYLSAARADFYGNGDPKDIAEPCHKTIDYSDPDWTETQVPDAPVCVGSLIFNRNNGKLPRAPERAALQKQVEQDSNVFRTDEEFIRHHTQESSMRSWEINRKDV